MARSGPLVDGSALLTADGSLAAGFVDGHLRNSRTTRTAAPCPCRRRMRSNETPGGPFATPHGVSGSTQQVAGSSCSTERSSLELPVEGSDQITVAIQHKDGRVFWSAWDDLASLDEVR